MDINRSHAPNSPAEPPSSSEAPRSPASDGQTNVAAARERGGALGSLADRRHARASDSEAMHDAPAQTSAEAGPSSAGERPRKRLRTEQHVRFARPEGEGSFGAGRDVPSQPMARLYAMPRHEADDPEQRRVNEQIAHNQRTLIDRLHIERQSAAALPRQDAFLAAAGQHLTPSELRSLLTDVLHLTEEARADVARLLPTRQGGAYLSRDEGALEHALGGSVSDVVVRRASWMMHAGVAARLVPGAAPSELLSRTVEQAQADLIEHFEHGGPSSQRRAVNDLIGCVLLAPSLGDAYRLAHLALQPRYLRAWRDSQRAGALSLLASALLSANTLAWMQALAAEGGAGAGEGGGGAEAGAAGDVARIQALGAAHRDGLAQIVPLLRDGMRGMASIPSRAAHDVLSSLARLVGRGMPDTQTRQALLDLYEHLLERVDEPERGPAYAELAAIMPSLGEAGLQRRAFDLVTRHRPGTPRTSDGLGHLDGAGRARVLTHVLYQLNQLGDDVRDDALALLSDQTAPGHIERLPNDAPGRLLEAARGLILQPGDNLRLLDVAGRLLDRASVDDVVQSLEAFFGQADTAPDDDALEDAVWALWDRFLPQLPADRSANLLAHAVAVDVAYLPAALRRFAGVDANRLDTMLHALNDHRSQTLAEELVERGIDDPDGLHATVQAMLAERPAAERADAASSIVHVLAWAATRMPQAQRTQAMRNSARAAIRIINDAPAQARAGLLAAYLRPEPTGRVGIVAFQFLAASMSAGRAPQFHRWLDSVPIGDRRAMATGVARLLPAIREQNQAALAVTVVEGIYPRSLESWSDHHALVQALTATLARWPLAFDVQRVRIGAMIEHGVRALPPGPEHEQALHHLAAIAPQLAQGASSSGEAPLATHAWAMQLIHSELTRTDDATRMRVLQALENHSGG
jgi:hypothetical protein